MCCEATITKRAVAWVGSVQPECTVPLSTWNFRNFKPEFLLNGKRPLWSLLQRVQKVMVSDLWLVDLDPFSEFLFFKGSLLVMVMTIDGSEKSNCEGGFWASEFACFWKAWWPAPKEYILQWFTQQNHKRDNTHCLNHKSYLHFTLNVTFTLTSKHTWVYLKASLVQIKHMSWFLLRLFTNS